MTTWLTLGIAAFVAFVAFLQWRAIREKLILDLFDRRVAVYRRLKELSADVLTKGIFDITDQPRDFFRETLNAEFLFGREVNSYLIDVKDKLFELQSFGSYSDDPSDPERPKRVAREYEIKRELDNLIERDLANLMRPYIGMDKKLPPQPERFLCRVCEIAWRNSREAIADIRDTIATIGR